jgi:choice-of-anchor B domain-containing protein
MSGGKMRGFQFLSLLIFGVLFGLPAMLSAQFNAYNVQLRAWLDLSRFGAQSGNDCWGYVSRTGREYALMGLNNQMAVVEITDPTAPQIIGSIPHSSSLWGDIKVYRDYAYVVNESGGGIQVVDLSGVDSGQVRLVRTITSPNTSHNIAVDTRSGFLYTCGSRGGSATTVFFDLTDPANPVEVGRWSNAYEHDIQAVTYTSGPYAGRQILFGSSEGRGLDVIDVTNKSNPILLSRTSYPNVAYAHQAWTEDLRYLYLDDELDNINRTIVFDITNLNQPIYVGEYSSGLTATDHNLYIRNGIVFESDYHSGLRIFDLNVDPIHPPQVGWFDTYPEDDGPGFDGSWSNYPYFPSGNVIISDINRGLFVVDPRNAIARLQFSYPNGQPPFINPSGGTRMRVVVSGSGVQPQPGTGKLHYDAGSGFVEVPLEQITANVYDAVFPALPCGTRVRYYISALDTTGRQHGDPPGAPGITYATVSAAGSQVVFADNFEQDRGWSVQNENLQDGAWERGIPAGDGTRGDPTQDFDGSGQCYLTGNRPGNSDVDGGPTRLISPVLNLSAPGIYILRYARWIYNDDGDDFLIVEASNDGGNTWVALESVTGSGGWVAREVVLNDFFQPNANVRIRFSIADNPNNSVTEAAIDAVEVSLLECGAPITVYPTSFSLLRGLVVSGGLQDLRESDDSWLVLRPGIVLSGEEAPIQLVLEGVSPIQTPMELAFRLEAHASVGNIQQTIELYDFSTQQFQQVDQRMATLSDSVVTVSITNQPERFVEQGTGRVRARIRYKSIGPVLTYPWFVSVDQSIWMVTP